MLPPLRPRVTAVAVRITNITPTRRPPRCRRPRQRAYGGPPARSGEARALPFPRLSAKEQVRRDGGAEYGDQGGQVRSVSREVSDQLVAIKRAPQRGAMSTTCEGRSRK